MYRVLIPTDFSANAYNALSYAKQLLADTTCTFFLLHTYTPAVYRSDYLLESPGQIGLGDVLKYNAERNLEKLVKRISKEFSNPKHRFVTHSAFNILYDEIDQMVNNEKIDITIMGTQGATGAKEIFLGTHAVHAMKKSTIPLLVVPPNSAFTPPKRILFPTDYEVTVYEDTIEVLDYLMKEHQCKLDIMHVSSPEGLSKQHIANQLGIASLFAKSSIEFHDWPDQDLIPAIEKFIEEHDSNLLVMLRNKHTFVERLFIEPVLKKIAFHIDIPFLILPVNP